MARRRGPGEGSIYKVPGRGWAAEISLGTGPDGKRDRRRLYGRTRGEVADKLVALQAERQRGQDVAARRLTVAEYLAWWLDTIVRPGGRAPKTVETYERIIRLHLAPTIGRHQLRALTPAHVRALLTHLGTTGLAPTSVRQCYSALRTALEQAVKHELVGRNVAALIDPPAVAPHQPTVLSVAEARRLLERTADDRMGAMVSVGLALGLRRGEIMGLLWEDVDLERAVLTVRAQLQYIDGALTRRPTKGKRVRVVPLPAVTVAALRHHRDRQQWERRQREREAQARFRWRETGYVFTTSVGTPLTPGAADEQFRRLATLAELPPATVLHDLRHACTSLLAAQRVPIPLVMQIVGHVDAQLTLGTYAHVMEEGRSAAAEAMDRALGSDA